MVVSISDITSLASLQAELRPWEGRAIMHLDLDAFFAAVAQKDNPELKGKPVLVGGHHDNRGVVATASYEARAFGVHSAMSAVEATRRCPDAIWVKPDFDRYRELSQKVFELVYAYTPVIERTSIDEVYADISPGRALSQHPVQIAIELQRQISELGLSGSIGLSNNKTTSKIGSDYLKPRGLTIVWPGEEAAFLAPLPIGKMGGVGAVTARKLSNLGITTLGELAQCDERALERLLGTLGPSLKKRAAGKDDALLTTDRPTKSISNETTFSVDLSKADDIEREIVKLSTKVGWRLRKEQLFGKTITLKLKFSDFTVKTIAKTLDSATSADSVIIATARDLYRQSEYCGCALRLLGVGVSNFCGPATQLNLLESESPQDCEREEQLLAQLDTIREKFGYGVIGRGPTFLDDSAS